ncbi:type II toxin-antitoxin system RelE/ParE family toxin [Candidimonas humi]|uniref:Type II toxin-antitoxin system RelE/ParE family toxin n=1 Tax=Candidimonas humi TaxID=683355 RepID=A0ABV8P2B4_9BURK|nr:type II toxin-antitoxin system RelE/ParE family toxin [Candidimonas humi]MBV6306540.1 type II toxin-antitoxin system RelE/ParE family toxin [Candidimonas humi]
MAYYRIEHYLTGDGHKDSYIDWLKRLRDNRAKVEIIRRVVRMEHGNLGDHRFCRAGVWELRIDVGPGYRVYYAQAGPRIVLLLGGDKRTQDMDIDRAVANWQDWQRREDDEKQTP